LLNKRVDHMVDHSNHYLFSKRGTFYYSRRVPATVRRQFGKPRFVRCLHTSNRGKAERLSSELSSRLENIWDRLRLDVVTFDKIIEPRAHGAPKTARRPKASTFEGSPLTSTPTVGDALELYIRLKAAGKGTLFEAHARRNMASFVEAVGSVHLSNLRKAHGGQFRDHLIDQGLSSSSINRVFSSVKAVLNLAVREWDIDVSNPLVGTFIPDVGTRKKRVPFTEPEILSIQRECRDLDDDKRWLLALISDTGMRLAEAAGILVGDIRLEEPVPHVVVQDHPWRRLKTTSSERTIPLVGASLWAAESVVDHCRDHSEVAFPRYTSSTETNSNSASAALNKWLKARVASGAVVHSFRHSLRDRLRAVGCPSDVADAIGGWTTSGIGSSYGAGYALEAKASWLQKIVLDLDQRFEER
jgi:integrase